jgi:archaeal flagellar protein FlaI
MARVKGRILRDLVSYGPLEPVMRDPNVEDLQGVGRSALFVVHRHFGMLQLEPVFQDEAAFEAYLRNLSERVGRPVSEGRPIVDASLPDGSRINIVFSESVSKRGPSFSVRRVQEHPASIVQLVKWGTLDAEMAAYLWLCIENGMSVFVCGESACGKTTTLNALLALVPPKHKVYTAEDTAEVTPPHKVWQRLLTRETGPEDSRVGMFDLLKAALRSRPNYIIVGEIRGAEGNVAFQAMQTGHPVIASFHASNVRKMIQRLTSEPINVPVTFIDNLNVAVFQQAVHVKGRLLRRIVSIDEIEGFSPLDGGVVTRPMFLWDRPRDEHRMKGKFNSHVLEHKIGEKLGDADPRAIYGELAVRTKVLERMVELDIVESRRVHELLSAYITGGAAALPFAV